MTPRSRLLCHIEGRLAEPDLSPRTAAAALGWSLRQVHAVLNGEPLSFRRCVTHLRLERARASLQQHRCPVIDVAFACGFDSLATFYRQYRSAFGTTPAAERRRLRVSSCPNSPLTSRMPADAGCTE